jgi:hypothetical protein
VGGQLLSCVLEGAAVSFFRLLMEVRIFCLSLSTLFVYSGEGRSRSLIVRLWMGVLWGVPLGFVGELQSYPSVMYELGCSGGT